MSTTTATEVRSSRKPERSDACAYIASASVTVREEKLCRNKRNDFEITSNLFSSYSLQSKLPQRGLGGASAAKAILAYLVPRKRAWWQAFRLLLCDTKCLLESLCFKKTSPFLLLRELG